MNSHRVHHDEVEIHYDVEEIYRDEVGDLHHRRIAKMQMGLLEPTIPCQYFESILKIAMWNVDIYLNFQCVVIGHGKIVHLVVSIVSISATFVFNESEAVLVNQTLFVCVKVWRSISQST